MSKTKMAAIGATKQVCLLSVIVLLVAGACFGKTAVSLSPSSGPPTSKMLVSGSGFKPHAAIEIFFDTKDEAKAIANGSGSFSKITIQAPASALPGKHWVSAVQRFRETGAHAPFRVNTNWSQFGFTADGKRDNPYENVLSPRTVGSLNLLWSYATGGSVRSSPAVVDGIVYVGSSDGNLYALKTKSGAKLWTYPTAGSPAVSNGVICVGSGVIYGLDSRTGAELWGYGTNDGVPSPPTVADGVAYLGGSSEDYALKLDDGTQIWKTHWGYADATSMAFSNGVVYFSTTNGIIYALDAATGGGSGYPQWSAYISEVNSSPAVANGVVYGGSGANVFALNSTTGASLWSYATGGTVSSPAIADGLVYVGSDDNKVYALNASDGTVRWSYATGGAVQSSPAVANGVVYVGSDDNRLYALKASDGALLWSYTTSGTVHSSPSIANGVVYVGSDDGKVYAFSLSDGTPRKSASAQVRQ